MILKEQLTFSKYLDLKLR